MNSPAPYDFNINLSKHNFDNAKNQLKAFSQKTDLKIDFPKVDTEGGFLNLGNHRVTGYELNKVTEAVQKYLTFLNSNDISIIKEFNNVYQTFEYLDQEYLSGIILGIKAAEKNAEEIKCTQNGLKKTVEEQKKIIAVLKKHKEKLENIVHLEDIDETWGKISGFGIKLTNIQEDILKLELNIKELVQDIEIINENIRLIDVEAKEHTVLVNSLVYDVKKNNESILKIFSFIDNLKKQIHLYDIDKTWNQVNNNLKNIDLLKKELRNNTDLIIKSLDKNSKEISEVTAFIAELSNQKHLNDIDGTWKKALNNEKETTEVKKAVHQNSESINGINKQLDEHSEEISEATAFIAELSNQKHLNDIDESWEKALNNEKEITEVKKAVHQNSESINGINKQLDEHSEEISEATAFIAELSNQKHLNDIDESWEKALNNEKEITEVKKAVHQNSESINGINKQLDEHSEEISKSTAFIAELLNQKHLNDIDGTWKKALNNEKETTEVKKAVHQNSESINGINKQLDEHSKEISEATAFIAELSNQKHLNDIDESWEKALNNEKEITEVKKAVHQNSESINGINKQLDEHSKEISEATAFIAELSNQKHLNDIDESWEKALNNEKEITEVKKAVHQNSESINGINKQLDEHSEEISEATAFIAELSNQKHLNDIDESWEIIERNSGVISQLQNDISSQNLRMTEYEQRIENLQKELSEYKNVFSRKLVISISIASIALAGVIGELLWIIMR